MLKYLMKFFIMTLTLTISLLLAEERSFFIAHSNDLIFGVDRDYSTGTEIGIRLGDNHFSLYQDIYTPDNKQTPRPINGERPYAGWLAVKAQHDYRLYNQPSYLALSLGTTGKRSQAQEVQRLFHRIINNDEIQGWESQHPNTYGYILELYNRYELPYLSPYSHLTLGNISRYWELGVHRTYKFNQWHHHIELWGELSERYVQKNLFLEADRYGYSVSKKDWVGIANIGIIFSLGEYGISASITGLTPKYTTQNNPSGYGTLRLSHPF